MKLKLSFGVFLFLALIQGCKKPKEEKLYTSYILVSYKDPVPNAKVTLYKSEIDFWAGKNEAMSGFTNGKGEYYIHTKQSQPDNTIYWVKAEHNELNNYRRGEFKTKDSYNDFLYTLSPGVVEYGKYTPCFLSTTPTKLQLRVFSNGTPVQGAKVFLYDSEVNYISKNNYEFRLFRDYSSGKENNRHFYILTDESGISNIINLEPKKYWFRIEKDGKSNANTLINTDGALPDDINITNIIEVGLN